MAERATSRTRSFSLLRGAIIACAIVAPIAGAIPTAAEEAAVTATKCDRLAGSTDDPNRVAPGVAYEEIPTRVAIATCVADLGKAPNTSRLQFNLARARARAGQSIQAIPLYTAAADRGMTLAQVRMAWLLLGGPDRLPRDIGEAVRNLKLGQARVRSTTRCGRAVCTRATAKPHHRRRLHPIRVKNPIIPLIAIREPDGTPSLLTTVSRRLRAASTRSG